MRMNKKEEVRAEAVIGPSWGRGLGGMTVNARGGYHCLCKGRGFCVTET